MSIPPLGCGLGGLNWIDVKTLIIKYLQNISNIKIIVFEPKGSPIAESMIIECKTIKMTSGKLL